MLIDKPILSLKTEINALWQSNNIDRANLKQLKDFEAEKIKPEYRKVINISPFEINIII